jgi:hypothetical protein
MTKNFSEHKTQTHMDVDNGEIPNAEFKCVKSTTMNQVDEGTMYSEEPVSDAKTPTNKGACASEIINNQHLVRPLYDVSDYVNESVTSRISQRLVINQFHLEIQMCFLKLLSLMISIMMEICLVIFMKVVCG